MLLFNLIPIASAVHFVNFNTSNVTIQLDAKQEKNIANVDFNTSNVTIQPVSAPFWLRELLFQYI